ncbi:hypothetical protein LZ31DRAFT_264144 [Colletotrichum somersetense]|nr:hypothetical protein LZ31DRAFT_264144 [Colletotrichum somersetense]
MTTRRRKRCPRSVLTRSGGRCEKEKRKKKPPQQHVACERPHARKTIEKRPCDVTGTRPIRSVQTLGRLIFQHVQLAQVRRRLPICLEASVPKRQAQPAASDKDKAGGGGCGLRTSFSALTTTLRRGPTRRCSDREKVMRVSSLSFSNEKKHLQKKKKRRRKMEKWKKTRMVPRPRARDATHSPPRVWHFLLPSV